LRSKGNPLGSIDLSRGEPQTNKSWTVGRVLKEAGEGLLGAALFFPMVALATFAAYALLLREVARSWTAERPEHQSRFEWWAEAIGGVLAAIPALIAFGALAGLLFYGVRWLLLG